MEELDALAAILSKYQKIGIDFDNTLVGHYNSFLLQEYVRSYFEKKELYIVTFRTHGLIPAIPRELRMVNLELNMFREVLSVPPQLWIGFSTEETRRRAGLVTGEQTEIETAYREWKGYICHKYDIPLLIDDNIRDVLDGCRRYGIDLIDTNKIEGLVY